MSVGITSASGRRERNFFTLMLTFGFPPTPCLFLLDTLLRRTALHPPSITLRSLRLSTLLTSCPSSSPGEPG